MSRETLSTQFWQASKILRQDDNTNSLLDYVEQISWLLFLKCFEELERRREDEAAFEGKTYSRVISPEYSWSTWTDADRRLSGQDLLTFLSGKLFPYLRTLQGKMTWSIASIVANEFLWKPLARVEQMKCSKSVLHVAGFRCGAITILMLQRHGI